MGESGRGVGEATESVQVSPGKGQGGHGSAGGAQRAVDGMPGVRLTAGGAGSLDSGLCSTGGSGGRKRGGQGVWGKW